MAESAKDVCPAPQTSKVTPCPHQAPCTSGAGDTQPLPRIPDTSKQEKEGKLKGFAFLTYLGLIVGVALFALCMLLLFLTGVWFALYHEVQETMSRTFAWEQIVRLMGSYYDDCIDYAGPHPHQRVPRNLCSYTFTLPWIPLVAGILCMTALVAFVSFTLQAWCGRYSLLWIKILITLFLIETMHFTLSIVKVTSMSATRNERKYFRQHLNFTMSLSLGSDNPPQMLSNVYPAWNLTQVIHQCCGVDDFSDWKFSPFGNGDPRYPQSCCNTEELVCNSNVFPTRYNVWKKGCFETELDIIHSYKNYEIVLLILTFIAISCTMAFSSQLFIFYRNWQGAVPGQIVKVNMFGKTFKFTRTEQGVADSRSSQLLRGNPPPAQNDNQNGRVSVAQGNVKHEQNPGICSVAINSSGIFLSSEKAQPKSTTTEIPSIVHETWV